MNLKKLFLDVPNFLFSWIITIYNEVTKKEKEINKMMKRIFTGNVSENYGNCILRCIFQHTNEVVSQVL